MSNEVTTVSDARAKLRACRGSLYAHVSGHANNVRVVGIITRGGRLATIATSSGAHWPIADVDGWIDGRSGRGA
jgi:hypothetical protein